MWPFARKTRGDATAKLGRRGETLARRHLRKMGLKLLARNYRCPVGEVDLIALDCSTHGQPDCETLVFVEVKTRSSDRHVSPTSAVNADKQQRIRKVARYYLSRRDAAKLAVRFDVISVVIHGEDKASVEHIADAF